MVWEKLNISAIGAKCAARLSSLIMLIVPTSLASKMQIVDLAMNNAGIRGTARALHISINAVARTLKNSHHDA